MIMASLSGYFIFLAFIPFAHVCTFQFDLDANVTVLPQMMIQLTEQDSINTFIFLFTGVLDFTSCVQMGRTG